MCVLCYDSWKLHWRRFKRPLVKKLWVFYWLILNAFYMVLNGTSKVVCLSAELLSRCFIFDLMTLQWSELNLSVYFCFCSLIETHVISLLRSSRDRERSSRDRSRERDRRDNMNGRSDSRRADDRDMGDLWRPLPTVTQPPPVPSPVCPLIRAPSLTRLPLFSFLSLIVNAADSECIWNIVLIQFSSIQIWQDCIWWED